MEANFHKNKGTHGLAMFLTGLSGSGKTTIAACLARKLSIAVAQKVVILDGDVMRQKSKKPIGFSKRDRDAHVLTVGGIARGIVRRGGIVICAMIAPYEKARKKNRERISKNGAYVEVYVATPLEECIKRDPKGLYAKVHAGLLANFTGIDDPYEVPGNPEIVLDTVSKNPDACATEVVDYLSERGYI